MEVQKDFKEFIELLNKHKVEFIIVGGYALAFHGAPRFTGDIDFFVKPETNNAKKILAALDEFGFAELDISLEDLSTPKKVIQLGVPPVRIDIITSITGVEWEDANASKIDSSLGGVPVYFIGQKEFIKNKKSTGRYKDLSDIDALENQ